MHYRVIHLWLWKCQDRKKTATTYINFHNNCLLVLANEDLKKKIVANWSTKKKKRRIAQQTPTIHWNYYLIQWLTWLEYLRIITVVANNHWSSSWCGNESYITACRRGYRWSHKALWLSKGKFTANPYHWHNQWFLMKTPLNSLQ